MFKLIIQENVLMNFDIGLIIAIMEFFSDFDLSNLHLHETFLKVSSTLITKTLIAILRWPKGGPRSAHSISLNFAKELVLALQKALPCISDSCHNVPL